MKRRLILFILTLGISLPMFSQVLFDFDIRIKTKEKNGQLVANVVVNLTQGETPIKYQIIEGSRIKGNVIYESEFINKRSYTFKDLPVGKYLLKIVDEQDRMAWKPFEISTESDTQIVN